MALMLDAGNGEVLYVGFNQDQGCFAVGMDNGFRYTNRNRLLLTTIFCFNEIRSVKVSTTASLSKKPFVVQTSKGVSLDRIRIYSPIFHCIFIRNRYSRDAFSVQFTGPRRWRAKSEISPEYSQNLGRSSK